MLSFPQFHSLPHNSPLFQNPGSQTECEVQLIACLPKHIQSPCFNPQHNVKLAMVVHTYNSCIWEAEAEPSGIQTQLHRKFKASLGNVELSLKERKGKRKEKKTSPSSLILPSCYICKHSFSEDFSHILSAVIHSYIIDWESSNSPLLNYFPLGMCFQGVPTSCFVALCSFLLGVALEYGSCSPWEKSIHFTTNIEP